MSKPPHPRTLAGLAVAVAGALPAWGWLPAVAGTRAGGVLLGPGGSRVAALPDGPPVVTATALLLAGFAVALVRHARRFQVPLTSLLGRAVGELCALPVILIVTFRVLSAVLPTPGLAAGAAALATGSVSAWLAHRWWRIPRRLLPDPEPGQIWWAAVPFEESHESKDRPCLVLTTAGRGATVLMFTSQDKTGRGNYVPVPPGVWRQPRRSFLRTDRRIRLRLEDFRRLEAYADPGTQQVAGLIG